jgi:hypothetical protein
MPGRARAASRRGLGVTAFSWLCTPSLQALNHFHLGFGFVNLQDVDGFGELAGGPGEAAEFAQDALGLELGVSAFAR